MLTGNTRAFSGHPLIVREPAIIASSGVYELANDHDSTGNIVIDNAKLATLWLAVASNDLANVDVKPVFLPAPPTDACQPALSVVTAIHAGADIWLADLATSGIGVKTVTSVTGGFSNAHVGHYLLVFSGTNVTPGRHLITAVNAAGTSITVDTSPDDGVGGIASGMGGVAIEFQDCSLATASGVTTVSPHYFRFARSGFTSGTDPQDGWTAMATFVLPAAQIMRLYVTADTTLTASAIQLGVTLAPPDAA